MPQFHSDAAEEYGQQLEEFTAAYIYALYFTDTDPDAQPDSDQDGINSEAKLSPDAFAQCVTDCLKFQTDNAALLAEAYAREAYGGPSQAGHDFWLTRNGHGAGFWDRAALTTDDLGDRLTEACKAFGNVDTYAGDDGLIYLS